MYTHKGGILGVVWKSVMGVEFARLPFDSAAKTSGFSEASVLYKMSLIVLPGNNSAGRIPRTQRVLQIELLIWDAQKNAFLWGDKLLILPYLFICFRCLFVSACVRLQRGLCLVFFFVCFVLVLFLCFVCGFCLVDFWFVWFFFGKCKWCRSVGGEGVMQGKASSCFLIPDSLANLHRAVHCHRL